MDTRDVYLDSSGRLFEAAPDGRLTPLTGPDGCLEKLSENPYSSFFKTPFYKAAYASGGVVKGDFNMTPGDFNPGSPFDLFYAVRQYLFNGRLYLPRLYLYPEAGCQSNCKLCQFHSRHRKGGSLSKAALLDAFNRLERSRGIRSQSLIVSGDGEPLIYPEIKVLLNNAIDRKLRVFLTTNLITDYQSDRNLKCSKVGWLISY